MPTLYEALGGADAIHQLVERFYDRMEADPAARRLRSLHPPDLGSSREKLYQFLTGWLGGPQLYVERHGHPRLRARHLPFPIREAERDAWMGCMDHALAQADAPPELRWTVREALARLADHMRNLPEGPG